MDYLDFGSTSESDDDQEMLCELDSDEEERRENKSLLRMLNLQDPPSRNQRNILDFEAEMEAELDRRALEIEVKGGMEHQKSLSRSSSNTSLNKSPRASPVPGSSSSQSRKSVKSSLKRQKSSSDTEMGGQPKSVKFAIADTPTDGSTVSTEETEDKQYDKMYFDSDDSDDDTKSVNQKRRFMTDDELFYDPASDAKDQEWVDKKRRKSYGNKPSGPPKTHENALATTSTSASNATSTSELPTTDAILNCPACFTAVCHDCQRHDVYAGQYRAMFVTNCLVNKSETLKIPEKTGKRFKKSKKSSQATGEFVNDSGTGDAFHPVSCKICKTQVAMFDKEEIYHFFNVLASQP